MVVINRMRWGQTVVPNAFIDKYIASANGEYVKVYIMLLRQMDDDISVKSLADALELTEKAVIRALSYWEKVGLLELGFEGDRLTKLVMMELPEDKGETITEGATINFADHGKPEKDTAQKASAREAKTSEETASASIESSAQSASARTAEATEIKTSTRTAEEILSVDEDFKQVVFVSEQFLGRTLTKPDLKAFVWLYDEIKFSVDLIEFLVEYCASLGKTKIAYIKAVASNWHEAGISTPEAAKEQVKSFGAANKDGKKPANNFTNFDQRKTDLDALIGKEIKEKHGA